MASDALNSSRHSKVRAILSRWTYRTSSCFNVRIKCAWLTWFLNDKTWLAIVADWAGITLIDKLSLGLWCLRSFFTDVAGIAVTIVIFKKDTAQAEVCQQVGQRVTWVRGTECLPPS